MNILVKRSLSGIVYVAILVGGILWCRYSFLALSLLFIGIMMHEFMSITMGNEYKWSQFETILTGLVFFTLVFLARAFSRFHSELIFIAILPMFLVMVNSLYVRNKSEYGKFANLYTALLYIAVPMTVSIFLVLNKRDASGEYIYNGLLLLCFLLIIWLSDIGAYVFGMALGQKYGKKLFPSVSPKKSWIGFWGGMLMAVVTSAVMYFTGMWKIAGICEITLFHAILLAALMNIAGVYGDLFESQWKRHYEVKDSGTIIPGHGGLLDRLDSTLFAMPVGALYLSIFHFINLL